MSVIETRRPFCAGDVLEMIVLGKAKDQRIRDLERGLSKWKLDWRAADQTVRTRNKEVMDLEREVERLKGETVRQGDLIRALIAGDMAKDPQL